MKSSGLWLSVRWERRDAIAYWRKDGIWKTLRLSTGCSRAWLSLVDKHHHALHGAGVIARQAMINQGFGCRPVEATKLTPLDRSGLAGVEHLVLEMARAKFGTESVPQELQQFHPLAASRFWPAHVTLDIYRRAGCI